MFFDLNKYFNHLIKICQLPSFRNSIIRVKRYPRLLAILTGIILLISFFSKCIDKDGQGAADPRGEAYAGSATCLKCHRNLSDSFWHTAHALTSRPANSHSVMGSFLPPDNEFTYHNGRKVVMRQRDSSLFQEAVVTASDGGAVQGEETHRFDIAVGSGRKAQTYLYWNGDEAFQLPVSYSVVAHQWANSPHYPMDSIWFGRVIATDCFGCHSSFIREKEPLRADAFNKIDRFDRTQMVYGIDCERCHGPGAQHAYWQEQHPQDRTGRYIAPYAALSRQQRLDMCAVCHSGLHSFERSPFRFSPGDSLSNFYYPEMRLASPASALDVHGNQYQLLIASKCFLKSKTMDCATCHDPHAKERDNIALFSQRCMTCHSPAGAHPGTASSGSTSAAASGSTPAAPGSIPSAPFCRLASTVDARILAANCIDCHMPALPSQAITMQPQGSKAPVADLIRTHLIAVYPDAGRRP